MGPATRRGVCGSGSRRWRGFGCQAKTLESHGLVKLGSWTKGNYATVAHLREQCPFGIFYNLPKAWLKKQNVLYAFMFIGSVRYVGETTAGMASRFNGYRYGNSQKTDTDNRVKLATTQALKTGNEVEIWAGKPIARMTLPDGTELEISASKLLEEHLLAILTPELNVKIIGLDNSSIST